MTKQKKIAYLTYLFLSSEHFGDFDYCFGLAVDSLNYISKEVNTKEQLRDKFLSYTYTTWNYELVDFI